MTTPQPDELRNYYEEGSSVYRAARLQVLAERRLKQIEQKRQWRAAREAKPAPEPEDAAQ